VKPTYTFAGNILMHRCIYQPILMQLETKKDIRNTTPHSKRGWCKTTGRGSASGGLFPLLFVFHLSFFVFLLTPTGHNRRPITTVYGSKRMFPRKVRVFEGLVNKNCPWNMILGGLNKHLKPNWRNFRIAISRKVRTRSTRNLKGNFMCINGFRGWSSITKL